MAEITVRLDEGRMAEVISQRCSAHIARRAEQLATQLPKIAQDVVSQGLGSGDGRSPERGMTSLHSLNWGTEVIHPGDFPVTVTLSLNEDAATMAKFNALSVGHGPYVQEGPQAFPPRAGYTQTRPTGTSRRRNRFGEVSTKGIGGGAINRQGNVVARNTQRNGRGGYRWLDRIAAEAKRRAASRF